MSQARRSMTVWDVMEILMAQAQAQEVPRLLAEEIAATTISALGLKREQRVTTRDRLRAEAYFTAVVRKRTVRGSAGSRAVARLVAAAVVDDLRRTGRDGSAVFDHLVRGWSGRLPADVLEEYRLSLCG